MKELMTRRVDVHVKSLGINTLTPVPVNNCSKKKRKGENGEAKKNLNKSKSIKTDLGH